MTVRCRYVAGVERLTRATKPRPPILAGRPKASPVEFGQAAHPLAVEIALEIAGNDPTRARYQHDGSIVVVN